MDKVIFIWRIVATSTGRFFLNFKRKKKVLLIFLTATLIFTGIAFFAKEQLSKKSVTEGIIGTFTERDLPASVTNLLSQSLVTLDKTGMPQPGLVSGWQTNNDATVFTFDLRDGLRWSDGTQLKASEIDIAIPDVEVAVLDDKKIEFKLADSFSPFPTLLTKPVFKKGSITGTGPYIVSSLQKDQIFFKKIDLKPLDKSFPEVKLRFYPNEKIARSAFRLGEIESLLGVQETKEIGENTVSHWSRTNYHQLVTVYYNTKDPVLSDENLRVALSFAAPVIPNEIEAKTPLSPYSWAFKKDDIRDYHGNEESGKSYLKKVNKDTIGTLTLTATSSLKDIGEKIVDAWNRIGVKSVLRVESGIPQNFQALLIAQNIPADPDQYSLWHSTQKDTNISKYAWPRVDKDLEDGRKILDLETRKQRYVDFQKVLLDHSPANFLYFPKYNVIFRQKVEPYLNQIIKLQLPYLFDP